MVLKFYMSSYFALHFCKAKKISETISEPVIIKRAQVYDWDHYLQCPKGSNSKSR